MIHPLRSFLSRYSSLRSLGRISRMRRHFYGSGICASHFRLFYCWLSFLPYCPVLSSKRGFSFASSVGSCVQTPHFHKQQRHRRERCSSRNGMLAIDSFLVQLSCNSQIDSFTFRTSIQGGNLHARDSLSVPPVGLGEGWNIFRNRRRDSDSLCCFFFLFRCE